MIALWLTSVDPIRTYIGAYARMAGIVKMARD